MLSFFSFGRQVKFRVSVTVHKLQAIPFRHGHLFLKVKFERRSEVTTQVPIDATNCATWEASYSFEAKLSVDNKTNVLKTRNVEISVKHVRAPSLTNCSNLQRVWCPFAWTVLLRSPTSSSSTHSVAVP